MIYAWPAVLLTIIGLVLRRASRNPKIPRGDAVLVDLGLGLLAVFASRFGPGSSRRLPSEIRAGRLRPARRRPGYFVFDFSGLRPMLTISGCTPSAGPSPNSASLYW